MTEEGWDVNKEFEKLLGSAKRINLFNTDEEYQALRQHIMSSSIENTPLVSLPFENIELIPYNEYIWAKEIENAVNQKKRVFYIKQESPYCKAACYYDTYCASFIILRYSYFSKTYSFDYKDNYLQYDREKLLYNKSFKDSRGLYITENIRCFSPSNTASFVLGRKASLNEWRDENGKSIVSFYPELARLHAQELKKKEKERNTTKKVSIILDLLYGVKKFLTKKSETHFFYIKEEGVCNASGYYNEDKKYFYICKDSLVAHETDIFYMAFDVEKARQNFLNKICKEDNGYYRVVKDAKCRTATAAASYVLGFQDDYTRWKDIEGKTLSEVYPNIYPPSKMKKEQSSGIEQTPRDNGKKAITGRPPRYFYIIREDMGNRSCNAKGMYDKINNLFIILEGSFLAYDVVSTYRFTASDIKRNKFIQLNCEKTRIEYRVKRDAICNSPDEAACFVLGENANGWIEWKSKSGISLENYINRINQ